MAILAIIDVGAVGRWSFCRPRVPGVVGADAGGVCADMLLIGPTYMPKKEFGAHVASLSEGKIVYFQVTTFYIYIHIWHI